jgi:GTP cyclohydrolase I
MSMMMDSGVKPRDPKKRVPKKDELENDPLRDLVRQMLASFGEDPNREGLVETPDRFAKSLRFLTSGYHMRIEEIVHEALYTVSYDEMVIVKDIEVFSLCEHHLLPFFGRCHVAYLPNKKVIGLSKIPRVVDMFSRRLQIQERLTHQIAQTLQEAIHPQGVGVVIEARHLCMMMRGVEKQHSQAVTSAMHSGSSNRRGRNSSRWRWDRLERELALIAPRRNSASMLLKNLLMLSF